MSLEQYRTAARRRRSAEPRRPTGRQVLGPIYEKEESHTST
jgi:hypothetical protein